jgi:hypothetical protein
MVPPNTIKKKEISADSIKPDTGYKKRLKNFVFWPESLSYVFGIDIGFVI